MKVFIAVASSEQQYAKSLRSNLELARRDGDHIYIPEASSYGSITRPAFLDAFRSMPEYDAYLALDADQVHPRHLLERLRAQMETHDLDMVCAHYYRRQTDPIQSLCYELGDGTWPFMPYLDPPTEGLHEIASTGQGCVLIHRRVIEAVWATLPKGQNPFDIAPLPHIGGDQQKFGSDMGFFIRARELGFRLWLDASLESLHAVTIWLGHYSARKLMDYQRWADIHTDTWKERLRIHGVNPEAVRQRLRLLEARKLGLVAEYEEAYKRGDMEAVEEHVKALLTLDGMLKESKLWLENLLLYPPIERADQLPTTESDPPLEPDPAVGLGRVEIHAENAAELIKELPRTPNARNGVGHA